MIRLIVLTCVLLNTTLTHAAIVIDVFELNGNLEATLTGSVDLNATLSFSDQPNTYDAFYPSYGMFAFGRGIVDSYRLDIDSFSPIGTGRAGVPWTSSSGDLFGMYGGGFVAVPIGYVSGTSLSASATRIGYSISGLTAGTHISTFSNGEFSDTITVRVGSTVPEVPLPAAAWLFGSALLGLVTVARCKQLKA